MNKIHKILFASLLFASQQVFAYDCIGLSDYSSGAMSTGQVVKHTNGAYQCSVGGWCSLGGAYEPIVGWAWTHAWNYLGACDGGVSSSSSQGNNSSQSSSSSTVSLSSSSAIFSSSSVASFSSSSAASSIIPSSCHGLTAWQSTIAYVANQDVIYQGTHYRAKWWTQGENPQQNSAAGQVWIALENCAESSQGSVSTSSSVASVDSSSIGSSIGSSEGSSVSSASSQISSSSTTVIYRNHFNQHDSGIYTAEKFLADWGVTPNLSAGVAAGRLSIVNDPQDAENKVLRVTYKQGEVGGNSASVFTYPILGTPHYQLWLQYKVMFDENFSWVKGGKLPGLAGFTGTKPTGCVANNLLNGFSARLMWRENGHALQYLYNPDKSEYCGDYSSYYYFFEKGRWHTI